MRRLVVVLCGLIIGLTLAAKPAPAMAWGKFGHLTVCDLAYRNLTPTTRKELNRLLKSESGGIHVRGRGKTDDRDYTSFNVGCLEEDEIPRHHPDDHFINVSRDATVIGPDCVTGPECILSGIQRDLAILKDTSKSDEDRVFAMMAVGHWVGDIHQPLHVSFADDRGGNAIDAKLAGKCGTATAKPDNVHAVWDNCLLEAGLFDKVRRRADFNPNWSPRTVTYRAVDTLMANTSLANEKAFVTTDPVEWANESFKVALTPDTLYCVQSGSTCRYSTDAAKYKNNDPKRLQQIDQAYLAAHQGIAEERVRRAGFRLAHLLNQALDPNYSAPQRDGAQPA